MNRFSGQNSQSNRFSGPKSKPNRFSGLVSNFLDVNWEAVFGLFVAIVLFGFVGIVFVPAIILILYTLMLGAPMVSMIVIAGILVVFTIAYTAVKKGWVK